MSSRKLRCGWLRRASAWATLLLICGCTGGDSPDATSTGNTGGSAFTTGLRGTSASDGSTGGAISSTGKGTSTTAGSTSTTAGSTSTTTTSSTGGEPVRDAATMLDAKAGADARIDASRGTGGASVSTGSMGSEGGARSFVHPGILHTQSEIDRMVAKVQAGAQPWKGSWDKLVASSFSQTTYTPNPQQTVCAGTGGCPNGETFLPLARDCAAAYQNALRYRISGETSHADKAVAILNAWSSTLQTITGDSNAGLRAGLYGYQLAAAAELVRDYPAWAAADFARLESLLTSKFYPISSDFLKRHNNTCFDHYWANWDLANMTTILAIGVLTDDRAKFDEAVTYFKNGVGTGQIDRMVVHLYPGNPVLGQGQESGRDQGHSMLDVALVGPFCKMAYDQGEDLFAYEDNKVLAMAEYIAKYNLGEDVPWTNYTNCEGNAMTAVSASGRGNIRPIWELIYNHYVRKKGLNAPYSQQFAEMVRPEGGGGNYGADSGGFDQLGFGTLAFTEDGP